MRSSVGSCREGASVSLFGIDSFIGSATFGMPGLLPFMAVAYALPHYRIETSFVESCEVWRSSYLETSILKRM